jgi:hypothetical protein
MTPQLLPNYYPFSVPLIMERSSHSSPLNQAPEAPMPKEGAAMLTVPAGNANEMLDQILNSAKPELEKNNEIKLPEATFAFRWFPTIGTFRVRD